VSLNRDFDELLAELNARGARYLLVGGYALSFYGRPRAPSSGAPDFVRNKRSVGRAQDIVDAQEIEAILDDRSGLE
jgi:hypothetical protein